MNDARRDLIAGIATAPGEGGIAIVRMSGAGALDTLKSMFLPAKRGAYTHAQMRFGHVVDAGGRYIDEALCVYFRAPASYTREDVVEIHCHGGRACARAVIMRAFALGARAAEAGEFTKRAFLNGRLDLAEAEAVMALVSAKSECARRLSIRQLSGGVSARVGEARGELISLMALIDACTDFPEEIDENITAESVRARCERLLDTLNKQLDERAARAAREGAAAVIIGTPNVGKSSLLNVLVHAERAIVTPVPGTTRDILTESVEIMGIRFSLSDTAGLRDVKDEVEAIGVERARGALESADCVILVIDASRPLTPEDELLLNAADARYIIVTNKCDLERRAHIESARVSAKTGEGVDALAKLIADKLGALELDDDAFVYQRHIECAMSAISAIQRAIDTINARVPLDFVSAELDIALNALGEITGETLNERVIDEIFKNFCVGK